MTTSLPKIKFISENSQTGSQKHLKFKKLKLSTDSSVGDIRQRFKSVRTERLSSLQRYSTIEEKRQYKKQKIHLNLLQRKLLTGTYDEAKETGNDLNQLKQKTDNFRTSAIQKHTQSEKIKQLIQQIKKQIASNQNEKKIRQEIVNKIQKKFDQQKVKTQSLTSQRSCLQHMISQRRLINHFLEGKLNQDKLYLTKLKGMDKQIQNEARQTRESMKNLQSKIEKINHDILREQRNREEVMYEKQYMISRRKEDEKFRQEKSKEYKKNLDEAEQQMQNKSFMELYRCILVCIFFNKFSQSNMQTLQSKYQVMENLYENISTYNKFDKKDPMKMLTRLNQLKPQREQLEEKIKKLEKKQMEEQDRNKKLQARYMQGIMTSKEDTEQNHLSKSRYSKQIANQLKQHEEKQDEKKQQKIKNETQSIHELIFRMEKWTQLQGINFDLKTKGKRNGKYEQIGKNLNNVLKAIQKDHEQLKQKLLQKK